MYTLVLGMFLDVDLNLDRDILVKCHYRRQ